MARARSHAQASLAPLATLTSLTDQFPLPPPSPLATPLSPKPPPLTSGPPRTPLPSVPNGPSRYSDHEAVLLLSSSSSIRSRLSIASRKSSDSFGPPPSRHSAGSTRDDEPDPHNNSSKELISSVEFPGETEEEDDNPTTVPDGPTAIDAQALHRHIRSARSRSNSHKRALQQWKTPGRAPSPDIDAILSTTPKPKRGRSFSNLSSESSARSKSRSKARSSASSRRRSEGTANSRNPSSGHPRVSKAFSDRSWAEEDFIDDYGTFSTSSKHYDGLPYDQPEFLDEAAIQKLEQQLEGDSGSDSDSSIDIHTPLPHLMVRHGLLSPRSKLLANPSRPGSTASYASNSSVVTKSGIIKDARDTAERRTRHRDGSQLRGGLGLTTGLGWSDSEDEDAPSALTKRISSLRLSRASSVSSMRSKASTRSRVTSSYSQSSLDDSHRKSSGSRTPSRQSKTPTRSRTPGASASSGYTNSFHLPNRVASPPPPPRPSLSASLNTISETRSIASVATDETPRRAASDSSVDSIIFEPSVERNSQNEDTSSSSTISVPPPVTPKDDSLYIVRPPKSITTQLPPAPTASKLPSTGLRKPKSLTPQAEPTVKTRARSSSTTALSKPPPAQPLPAVPSPSAPGVAVPRTPRPLQLPLAQGRSSLSAVGGDRTSGLNTPRTPSHSQSLLPASFNMVSAPNTPTRIVASSNARPKPRTGTGMVYRSTSFSRRQSSASDGGGSTSSAPAASRLRTPSTSARQKPIPI
ncbi:hypothetical protein DL96DRAFT_1578351 [Flagelloscypha sp. PMI_526]|nr:hypothetical protein DL96DRAFT_1578351 [Flagelloscypha sp. PMI_526]